MRQGGFLCVRLGNRAYLCVRVLTRAYRGVRMRTTVRYGVRIRLSTRGFIRVRDTRGCGSIAMGTFIYTRVRIGVLACDRCVHAVYNLV